MTLADLERIAGHPDWDAGDVADVKASLPKLLSVVRQAETMLAAVSDYQMRLDLALRDLQEEP